MVQRQQSLALILAVVGSAVAFQAAIRPARSRVPTATTHHTAQQHHPNQSEPSSSRWWDRLHPIRTVSYQGRPLQTAGVGRLFGKVKKLHNPITYFILGIMAGFRWDWCFKSPIYWFAIGFTIKWYRARYVFKIPVWDRQPNWNNIITSKEQEKDLKAFTCKNCGSTIFIAKTREFFFEGSTGIGGLGCFACGAKGRENFEMDRDRIVEDVGDMDDYFDYEQPLDFVSRGERRKLMKEAGGDEVRANQILLERSQKESPSAPPPDNVVNADIDSITIDEPQAEESSTPEATSNAETPKPSESVDVTPNASSETALNGIPPEAPKPKKKKKKKKQTTPDLPPTSGFDLDGLEELDMDAW